MSERTDTERLEPKVTLYSFRDDKGKTRWQVEIETPAKTMCVCLSPAMRSIRTFWKPPRRVESLAMAGEGDGDG